MTHSQEINHSWRLLLELRRSRLPTAASVRKGEWKQLQKKSLDYSIQLLIRFTIYRK